MNKLSLERCLYKTRFKAGKLQGLLSIVVHPDIAKVILDFLDVRILLQQGQHITIFFSYSFHLYGTLTNNSKNTSYIKRKKHCTLSRQTKYVDAIIDRIDKINLKKRIIYGRFQIYSETDAKIYIQKMFIDRIQIGTMYLNEYI